MVLRIPPSLAELPIEILRDPLSDKLSLSLITEDKNRSKTLENQKPVYFVPAQSYFPVGGGPSFIGDSFSQPMGYYLMPYRWENIRSSSSFGAYNLSLIITNKLHFYDTSSCMHVELSNLISYCRIFPMWNSLLLSKVYLPSFISNKERFYFFFFFQGTFQGNILQLTWYTDQAIPSTHHCHVCPLHTWRHTRAKPGLLRAATWTKLCVG